jgi:hypothetical protein
MKIEHIEGLDNDDINVKNPYHFESPTNLPSLHFHCGIIGAKGTGKTVALCNIVNFYKGYFDNIFVICPNYSNELKLKETLPPTDHTFIYTNPNDDAVHDILKYIKEQIGIYKQYLKDLKTWKNDMKIYREFMNTGARKLTTHELFRLEMNNYNIPLPPEKCEYDYYPTSLLVVDDCMNTDIFRKKSLFTNTQIRNRHLFLSIIIVSQSYKGILKPIRLNLNWLVIFRINDLRLLKEIHEENSSIFKDLDQFLYTYDYCTQSGHDFMYIDINKKEVRRNFNERIVLDKNE